MPKKMKPEAPAAPTVEPPVEPTVAPDEPPAPPRTSWDPMTNQVVHHTDQS